MVAKYLEWHAAPALPEYEGGGLSVLTYCERSCSYEVAVLTYEPDNDFLIGVSQWAVIE